MSTDQLEVADLDAICGAASASARDLSPPDLRSMVPPPDLEEGSETRARKLIARVARTSRTQRVFAASAGALLAVGLALIVATGGEAEARSLPAPPAARIVMAAPTEGLPAVSPPPVDAIKLPPPPTTGTAVSKAPPPARVAAPGDRRGRRAGH